MISVDHREDRRDRSTVPEVRPDTERVLETGNELQRTRLGEADDDEDDHERPEEAHEPPHPGLWARPVGKRKPIAKLEDS